MVSYFFFRIVALYLQTKYATIVLSKARRILQNINALRGCYYYKILLTKIVTLTNYKLIEKIRVCKTGSIAQLKTYKIVLHQAKHIGFDRKIDPRPKRM